MTETSLKKIAKSQASDGVACSRPRRMESGFTRCWNRDYATCPSCAALHALYTKKLIGSGMDETEGYRFYFVTLTAPSFGKIHEVPHSPSEPVKVCKCGIAHEWGSVLSGVPLDLARYRYRDAVEWNHNVTKLFHRSMDCLTKDFSKIGELEWSAVREFQNRGLIHFHIIVRVPVECDEMETFAKLDRLNEYSFKSFKWGKRVDVKVVHHTDTEATVRYLSKVVMYATKTLGKSSDFLSDEQREFFAKLDAASIRLKYSSKAVRGFGYAGHTFSKSGGWSNITKRSLKEDSRRFAEMSNPDNIRDKVPAAVSELNSKELRDVAARFGNGENYEVPVDAGAKIRERILGSVKYDDKYVQSEPLTNEEIDEVLNRLEIDDLELV